MVDKHLTVKLPAEFQLRGNADSCVEMLALCAIIGTTLHVSIESAKTKH